MLKQIQYYGKMRVLFFKLCPVSAIKFHPWKHFLLSETTGFIKPRFVVSVMSHYEVLHLKYQYTGILMVSYQFPLKTEELDPAAYVCNVLVDFCFLFHYI